MTDIPRLPINREQIEAFCQKWKIIEFSFFGSVLRDDFGPDSDVDVLVVFDPKAHITFFDLMDAEAELSKIIGRKVDFIERSAIEQSDNYIRRKHILEHARQFYVA